MILSFKAKPWLYDGHAAWHFITLPKTAAQSIRGVYKRTRGWGSVPVRATIGNTHWQTSVFPDKKTGSFVLPLKAEVRKREGITLKTNVSLTLIIQ